MSPGRAVTGVPAAPLRVDGGNEWILKMNGPELLAWADWHKINWGGGFQNNQVIETGRGCYTSAVGLCLTQNRQA